MNILLTGAAGFIGSCFLRKLNDEGHVDIWLVDTASSAIGLPTLAGKRFRGYLTREELLPLLKTGKFDHLDLIVHLGACSDTTEMDRVFLKRNNFEYSRSLARWACCSS